MKYPLVSIVILTRNRISSLIRCMNSILNNTYKNFEIIILDNSVQNNKEEILKYWKTSNISNQKLVYFFQESKGFAEMRQTAINLTSGKIIISIDDDCVMEKNNIKNIVNTFLANPKIGIVGGNIQNIGFKGNEKWKGRGQITKNGLYVTVEDPKMADVFGSANMSFLKKAFNETGGYDFFFNGGFEEADLTFSIKSKKYQLVYNPQIKIKHYNNDNRYRNKHRNIDILRLYFFFKYFYPRNLREWKTFFLNEFYLFASSSADLVKQLAKNHNGDILYIRILKFIYHFGFQTLKMIVARIIVPYLYYIAQKERRRLKKRSLSTIEA